MHTDIHPSICINNQSSIVYVERASRRSCIETTRTYLQTSILLMISSFPVNELCLVLMYVQQSKVDFGKFRVETQ